DISKNGIKNLNGSVFGDLTALQTLKLEKNELQEIPVFPRKSGIKELFLAFNNIPTIPALALERMPNLTVLDLSHNYILSIVNGTFPAGCMLIMLNLNNNHIAVVEKGALNNLTELHTLKMNKNKLRELPVKGFEGLFRVKTLELMKNDITTIRGLTFQGMKRLHTLKLKRNDISTLETAAFYELPSLVNLQLGHNKISAVQREWMYGLKVLRTLSLPHNKIAEINPESLVCKHLEKLDLSHNQLRAIMRDTIAPLKQLKQLSLDHNRISTIDESAFNELRRLQILIAITCCQDLALLAPPLQIGTGFHSLSDCVARELNHNEISWSMEDVTGVFHSLNRLNRLGLKANGISTIPVHAFSGLQQLKELSLDDNDITSIQENAFETLRKLESLTFNSSKFTCDCHLSWLPDWLQANGFSFSATGTCFHPPLLKGVHLYKVDMDKSTDCNDGEYLKPVIFESPRSTVGYKGENMSLECVSGVAGNSQPIIKWKKGKSMWVPDSMFEVTAARDGEINRYTSRLYLRNIQDSAEGSYQCVVSNDFGRAYSERAHITVYVYPVFTEEPTDVTVKAGKNAELKCAATGQPMPTISWKKDGGDNFPAARERRMQVYPDDSHFYILSVQAADQGVYTCKAENDAGTVTSNATVTVLETPDFVQPMKRKKSTRKGDTSVLQCMASGSPQPKLSWLKDGKSLVMTPRHFFTVDSQILVIVETQWSDAGVYSCRISNSLGTAKGTTELQVLSASGEAVDASSSSFGLDDKSTTTGIIIIAVVCCVVGTSLVWVIIIYQTRKRHEMYSAAPSDETTLPGEVPSSGYMSSDREGSYSQGPLTTAGYHYQDYQMKESGYESSSGQFRVCPVIYPNGVDEDEPVHRMTAGDRLLRQTANANSAGSLQYAGSEGGDTLASRHSTSSGQHSGTSEQLSSHSCRSGHSSSPAGHNHPQLQLHVQTGNTLNDSHSPIPPFELSPLPDYCSNYDEESGMQSHYIGRYGGRGSSSGARSPLTPSAPPLLQTFHPKKQTSSSHERFLASTLEGTSHRKERDEKRKLMFPHRRAVSRDAVAITEKDSDEDGAWVDENGFRPRTHSDSCDKRMVGYNQYHPVSLGKDGLQTQCSGCGCRLRVGDHLDDRSSYIKQDVLLPHEIQVETGCVNCSDSCNCYSNNSPIHSCTNDRNSHRNINNNNTSIPFTSSSASPLLSPPSPSLLYRHSHHHPHQQTKGLAVHGRKSHHLQGCVNKKNNNNNNNNNNYSKKTSRNPQNDCALDSSTHGNLPNGGRSSPPCCCEVMRDTKYCTTCTPRRGEGEAEHLKESGVLCCHHCSHQQNQPLLKSPHKIYTQQSSGRAGALQTSPLGKGSSMSSGTLRHDPGYSDCENCKHENKLPSKHHPQCTNHSSKLSSIGNRPSASPPPYSTLRHTPPPYILPPDRLPVASVAAAAPRAPNRASPSTIPTSPSPSNNSSSKSKKNGSSHAKNNVHSDVLVNSVRTIDL
ncbi:leucine-rich repeats and immunoglobulin domains protein 1, partial [Plakobranchus ocellatus]